MSATNVPNRKGVTRPRNADDFYATPSWVTRAILPHLGPYTSALDPCCGDGAILRELRGELHGIETDGGRALACVESDLRLVHMVNNHDALVTQWPAVDLIITNPPFALAMEFLKLALEESGGRGEVAFLLRLAFLEGQARAAFHRAHPSDVYVLPKRPSFTGDGKSDSCAYAWFVFGPGRGGRWSVLDSARRPAVAPVTWTVKLVCPDCRHVVASQRGVTEAERARAEGPRPVLVCGSRRCGASVRTMDVVWIREENTDV